MTDPHPKPTVKLPWLRLLAKLAPEVFSLFGVFVWGWSFFPIIYLFWWELLLGGLFKRIGARLWRKQNWISVTQHQAEKIAFKVLLFVCFVYFIFIFIGLGIAIPGSVEESIENLQVAFFRDYYFNIAFLLVVFMEIYALSSAYREALAEPPIPIDLPFTTVQGANPFNSDLVVMHLTLIFGVGSSVMLRIYSEDHPALKEIHADRVLICIFVSIKAIPLIYKYIKEEIMQ